MAETTRRDHRLYSFQTTGVRRLLQSPRLLLADEMGLGKTPQALVAMSELMAATAITRTLIVCPASLLANWQYELRQWVPNCPSVIYRGADRYGLLESGVPVLIASFETVTADWRRRSQDGRRFFDTGLDLMIVDEAQRLRNPDSLSAKVLTCALVPRRWALTGRPVENRPEDLGSILRVLEPNEFPSAESLRDYERILRLRDSLMLRRSKAEVLPELPERTMSYVPVEMAPAQRDLYNCELERLKSHLHSADRRGIAGSRGFLLGGIQRLRALCAVGEDENDSGKLDYLEEEIGKLAQLGEKAVVFSTFANKVLPAAASRLQAYGTVIYRGSMSLEEKEQAHAKFISDSGARVMLASLRAAGLGLTWTVARYVYHLDLWWNPQALRQAEDRVYRIGQQRGVLVKRLFASESVEEGILGLVAKKEEMFGLAVAGRAAARTEDAPTDEELRSLLRLEGL